MVLGPIPLTAIWEWEDRNGITDPRVRAHVEAVISAVDVMALKRNRTTADEPAKSPEVTKRRRVRS
jgi:hypothetical protein